MSVKFSRLEWVLFGITLISFALLGFLLYVSHQMIGGDNHLKPLADKMGVVVIALLLISGFVSSRSLNPRKREEKNNSPRLKARRM